MRRLTLLFLIIALTPGFLMSQTEDYQREDRERVFIHMPGTWVDIIEAHAGFKPSNKIEGTPYVFNEWKKGRLFLTENRVVKDFTFNYNSCRNFLVYRKDNKQYTITKTDVINSVQFGGKELVKVKIPDNRKFSEVFMQELVEGENGSLYKHFFCKLNAPEHNEAMNVGSEKFEYTKMNVYYLKRKDGTMEKLPTSKWRLYRTFSDKKSEIKDFVKSKDLDPDKEEDLKMIVRHYNDIK
jgi:hypothetical protein